VKERGRFKKKGKRERERQRQTVKTTGEGLPVAGEDHTPSGRILVDQMEQLTTFSPQAKQERED